MHDFITLSDVTSYDKHFNTSRRYLFDAYISLINLANYLLDVFHKFRAIGSVKGSFESKKIAQNIHYTRLGFTESVHEQQKLMQHCLYPLAVLRAWMGGGGGLEFFNQ